MSAATEELPEVLAELAPGQWVVVEPPGGMPTPAMYLGWVRDERGDIMAIVRPKGWEKDSTQAIAIHPSCIVETEWNPNSIATESAWKD